MNANDPLHYTEKPGAKYEKDDVSGSFSEMFNNAIGKVNDLQVDAEELNQKMIYEPESVDVHTVMIAAQKAEVSLLFAKSVRDEAVKAYRELMNLR